MPKGRSAGNTRALTTPPRTRYGATWPAHRDVVGGERVPARGVRPGARGEVAAVSLARVHPQQYAAAAEHGHGNEHEQSTPPGLGEITSVPGKRCLYQRRQFSPSRPAPLTGASRLYASFSGSSILFLISS